MASKTLTSPPQKSVWCKHFVEKDGWCQKKGNLWGLSLLTEPETHLPFRTSAQMWMLCLPARTSGVKLCCSLKHKVSNSLSPFKPQLTCYFIGFLPSLLVLLAYPAHTSLCSSHCPLVARFPQTGGTFEGSLGYLSLYPQTCHSNKKKEKKFGETP